MKNGVLVLNQDYSPLTVCSVERAFLLVYLSKAELLAKSTTNVIRTVSNSYPFPSVIRISRYVTVPFKGVVLTRHNVFKRDRYQCQYCGTSKDLTLDHLVPRSKGGTSSWSNLVTACRRCNARKGDFTLEEANMKPKVMPYKPSYVTFLMNNQGLVREEWLPYLQQYAKSKAG